MKYPIALALACLAALAGDARAQSFRKTAPELFATPATLAIGGSTLEAKASDAPLTLGSWTTPAKWITLGSAAGLAILGFVWHEQADDAFSDLEFLCNEDPPNCRDLNPDGSYRDPQLEFLYQETLSRDNRARASLIAANVTFAASAALFIIDFQKKGGPGDIPYHPPEDGNRVELSVGAGELTLRYFLNGAL